MERKKPPVGSSLSVPLFQKYISQFTQIRKTSRLVRRFLFLILVPHFTALAVKEEVNRSSSPSTYMHCSVNLNSFYLAGDPDLTQQGVLDCMNVHVMWETEKKANIGLPQISYCSPLYRALLTNTISFGVEVYYDSNTKPDLTTTIVEVSLQLFSCFAASHQDKVLS